MRFATSIAALATGAALAAGFVGCSSGDKTLGEVDPQAVTAEPTFDQVNAIIHNKCAFCHVEGKENYSPLTTCTDIVAQRFDIVTRVENNTMPPGVMPRLTSEEILTIERWVGNGAPAPCNP